MDQIEALKKRSSLIEKQLGSSSTAYAPKTTPTSSDLSLSSQLVSVNSQIDDLKGKQIRNKWYGPSDVSEEDAGESKGLIVRGLSALQKPLNVVAGTAQYALGKGTKSTLAANINEAMRTGLVAGDVLKQFGAPRAVQVPLGFALDVMFDPINWATAGTAALIPRIGTGLAKGLKTAGVKGAIEAGTTGLTSGVQKKAFTALNMVPFAKKSAKYAEFTEGLGKKAIIGAEKFDTLTGKTVADKLGKLPYLGGIPAGTIGKGIEDVIRGKTVVPGLGFLRKEVGDLGGEVVTRGDTIVDFFKYSTKQSADVADLKDKVFNLARDKGIILERSAEKATFKSVDDFLRPDAKITLKDKINETTEVLIKDADGVVMPEFATKATVEDSLENAKRLLNIAGEDYNLKHLIEAYKITPPGKTGFKWYDDVIEKLKATTIDDIRHGKLGVPKILDEMEQGADDLVKNWNSYDGIKDLKPLNKLLTAYPEIISVFKFAKVPLNAGAHVVANIGNMVMGSMMGIPVHSSAFRRELAGGISLSWGRMNPKGFKDMFFDDLNSWVDFMDKNPNRFRQMTGMDVSEIREKIVIGEDFMKYLNKGEVKKMLEEAFTAAEEIVSDPRSLRELEKIAAGTAESFGKTGKIAQASVKEGLGKIKTPSETLRKLAGEAPIRRAEEAGSWAANEIYANKTVSKMTAYLEEAAQTSGTAKILHAFVNSMPKWYERTDQSWKIGTTSFLTKVGLNEQQLIAVSRTVPINMATDVLEPVVKGAEKLYRLTPLKASEVAMEAYMNYAAMPDFVRMMRAIPIAGVPFISFQYAMAVKTAKTLVNKPAIFNKIGFIMNEMNAGRSPQDRAALEEKYNTYLKSPTVVKMFGMWNTDVKNMVPYYTMNIFSPSEKKYDDSFRSQMLKQFDKVPIFQDPIGQIFRDYIIQPWVLSGSGQAPQGVFGQPLYPSFDEKGNKIDVGLGTKAFYGARTVAESFVPGSLSYLGLPLGLTGMSPDAVGYIPSYGIRNILNATQGRSSIGAQTKENALQKTLRAVLGRTGVPAYTLDVTKTKTK